MWWKVGVKDWEHYFGTMNWLCLYGVVDCAIVDK